MRSVEDGLELIPESQAGCIPIKEVPSRQTGQLKISNSCQTSVNGGIGLMSLVASGNKTSCSVKSVPCNSVLKQQSEGDNLGDMPEESIVEKKTCLLQWCSQGEEPEAQDTVFLEPTGDGAESSVPLTDTKEIIQSNTTCKTNQKIEVIGSPVKTCGNLQR
ncbi:MAG: hypothetical protein GY795_14510, partial [Desulfobacterales bacterium]|nr:hypothetical protein [Desulfobacterales bacterium]